MDDTQRLEDFVSTARAYCAWIEGFAASPDLEAETAALLLSKLCAQVNELPELFDDEDAPRLEHKQWVAVYQRLSSLPFNYYATFAEPSILESPEPVTGDLADDLADVWRDLRAGLALYDKGNGAAAAWEWRESFRSHWGRHATSALYAIQCWRS
ncbi:DUF5063 domain-containing protein [Dokdonella sp. MW10]|uniref:DUF5063 domain-containing protein n=1 Tax=Dokdonella sp. MW10 TaxID=2992926 RepID=UPI003F822959